MSREIKWTEASYEDWTNVQVGKLRDETKFILGRPPEIILGVVLKNFKKGIRYGRFWEDEAKQRAYEIANKKNIWI